MRYHTITFHLAKSEATVASSTLRWLPSQDLGRASTTRVDLVSNHVLKTLIISWVQEDHDFEALASEAIVHDLVAVPLVAQTVKLIRNELDCLALERRSVSLISIQTGHLGQDGLDQMTDRHARRDSVRVDNHVRYDSLHSERQVLLSVRHSNGTFLSVTTSKFISDLRHLNCAHFHLDKSAHLLIRRHDDLVNVAFLRVLEWDGPISPRFCVELLLLEEVKFRLGDRCDLTNDDVITTDLSTRADDTILVKLVVSAVLATRSLNGVRDRELLLRHQGLLIGAVKDRSEESTIDRTLIEHDRIFLIVA